jgi:3'-5' exoribonuclease
MQIITKEMLKTGRNGQDISGVILVRNYGIQLTKKNEEYVTGTLESEVDMPFKAWGNSTAFSELKKNNYTNVPTYISGKFNEFNGQMSIIIDTAQAVEGYTQDQFMPIKYNAEAYWQAMINLVKAKVSEYAYSLADRVLFSNKEVADSFKVQFAASSHHDNCKSGLLAHTYKVLSNVNYILSSYPKLVKKADGTVNQDKVDVLFIGALLHDIGKIREMDFGVYQTVATVTHRYLGIEFFSDYKAEIVEHYSEEWYYDLVSIMLQHHGEFGDNCRTVSALIVHKADLLDSEFTLLADSLANPITNPSAGDTVKFDGLYLTI